MPKLRGARNYLWRTIDEHQGFIFVPALPIQIETTFGNYWRRIHRNWFNSRVVILVIWLQCHDTALIDRFSISILRGLVAYSSAGHHR